MYKEVHAFLPAMHTMREDYIAQFIKSNNNTRTMQLAMGNLSPNPELTRATIDMSQFRMLKTQGGCGSELNAITKIINENDQTFERELYSIQMTDDGGDANAFDDEEEEIEEGKGTLHIK